MALVLSTDLEPVRVQAYGNWFEFKPGQMKMMQDHISDFLCTNRRDKGFVSVPESYQEDPQSPDNKKLIEDLTSNGRKAIVDDLRRLRYNFEVSTQKDIDVAGEKRSFITEMQSVHKEMYRRLALFKNAEQDYKSKDEDEVKKYMEIIDGNTSKSDAINSAKTGKTLPKSA